MESNADKYRPLSIALLLVCVVFMGSMVLSFRAISSSCVLPMIVLGLLYDRKAANRFIRERHFLLFLLSLAILYALVLFELLYTNDLRHGWIEARQKSALLFTPLAFAACAPIIRSRFQELMQAWCLILLIASVYCLGHAIYQYTQLHDDSLFYYHRLVQPLSQHAVYFSVLLLFAVVYLVNSWRPVGFISSNRFRHFLILFFSAFIFLLSSKLLIVLLIGFLSFQLLKTLLEHRRRRATTVVSLSILGLACFLLLALRNPVSQRFGEILHGDLRIITKDSFQRKDYFNGLQFRLLQWRFVGEILTEQHAWWTGVSPGDAQDHLNRKYVSRGMYAGDPQRGDKGYLIYNTHNQYLETLLQSGFPGLVALLIACGALIIQARRNPVSAFIVLVLLAWMFTESIFETQYGCMIFTFFPFLPWGENKIPAKSHSTHPFEANHP